MLSDDNLFHMKNLLGFFMEDEHLKQYVNENLEEDEIPFIFEKNNNPKQKYQSILLESAFKEIANIGNSMREGTKNDSSVKKEPANLKRNIFSNMKMFDNKQNFSETFKSIDEIWNKIITKPQSSISKSFSLKNFVIFSFPRFFYFY